MLDQYTILYVDDEESNLRIFKTTFKRQFHVVTMSNPFEALQFMQQNPAPIVVSDHRMPQMTGVEFLAKVYQLFPQTVRMILTGYCDVNNTISAINEGKVYRYIIKPWDRQQLGALLEEAIQYYHFQQGESKVLRQLAERNKQLEAEISTLKTANV